MPSRPRDCVRSLNFFVIYVSLPALVFSQAPDLLARVRWSSDFFIPVSMGWLQLLIALGSSLFLSRIFKWSSRTTGALVLTAGFGNTSFVGLPLLNALIGPSSVPTLLIADQFGSFLGLSTAGLIIAASFAPIKPGEPRIRSATYYLKRVATFPPFVSLVLALGLAATLPSALKFLAPTLMSLSSTLIPLALISVGLQISFQTELLRSKFRPLFFGLLIKLLLVPIFLFVLYYLVLGHRDLTAQVTLLESAMAPMITAAVVAGEFDLDLELANLMVSVGILLSLASVPAWFVALKSL